MLDWVGDPLSGKEKRWKINKKGLPRRLRNLDEVTLRELLWLHIQGILEWRHLDVNIDNMQSGCGDIRALSNVPRGAIDKAEARLQRETKQADKAYAKRDKTRFL